MNINKDKSLYLIYRFTSVEKEGALAPSCVYEVLYYFSGRGEVPLAVMKKVFNELFLTDRYLDGGFYSLDELELFAQTVCQQIEAPEVYVISNHDYNTQVAEVYNVRGIKDVFHMQGKCIRNPDFIAEKKSFFSKLF